MSIPQRIPNYFGREDTPSWDFLQKWVPGQWTLIGIGVLYTAPWRNAGSGAIASAMWRLNGDYVEFKGLIDKAGGNFAGNDPIMTLPTELRDPDATRGAQEYYAHTMIAGGGVVGAAWVILNPSTGLIRMASGYGYTGGPVNPVSWMTLTGLRFPLNHL